VILTALLPVLLADQGLPGWLIQALLVFFFIGLPILRSIREMMQKKKELEQRRGESVPGDAAEVDPAAQMEEARRRFEALLRGETVASPVAEVPPPVPVMQRPKMADTAMPGSRSGDLSGMSPAPSEDQVESANDVATADPEHFIPDEEERAREAHDRRLREEREARTAFLQRERETGAGRRANVTSDPMTSLGAPTAAATIQRAARPDIFFGEYDNSAARRAGLRRAILAAEVLGAPVALRDPATGPVGMRRPA